MSNILPSSRIGPTGHSADRPSRRAAGEARPRDRRSTACPTGGPQRVSVRMRGWMWAATAVAVTSMAFGLPTAVAQDTSAEEANIAEARERQRDLEVSELLARTQLHIVSAELADVQDALDAATELLRRHEARVAAVQVELDAARLQQRQIGVAIDWAEYDLQALDDALAEVAVEAYLGNVRSDGAELLQSEDIQEGTTRIAMLEIASSRSEDVVDLVRGIREQQKVLEEEQADIVTRVAALEAELSADLEELEASRALQAELRDAVDGRVAEWRGNVDRIEREDQELENFIAEQQRIADNKKAVAEGRQPDVVDVSGDGFIWPTAGRVGSGFGQRLHPILGYYRMHSGLDIGGPQGQPIYATTSGTVIVAGVQGGYGNTIVIDHGDGLSSLYAHQESFEVGNGDWVDRGDLIGYVGSTGMSTGPHLHFEIRQYGTPIDPMPYMP